ncbi:hypothetical protein BJ986_001936 [Phycicoccus badiiscoriae]|uniref:Lipoprotein n=1 Tax=Pedococcus badiiscoriae TaxID=642776 RepID=A0A852WFA3_9MICO|nr:hypothetical protein [Pedococcus badiiscoriae]NYG07449.1 hypothetical protein [Pedococcus badiiscoriae]
MSQAAGAPWCRVATGPLAAVVLSLGASACTGAQAGPPATSAPPDTPTTTSNSASFVARMDALMASVNRLQDADGGAVVSVPARPTVVQRPTGLQTMIIRDEDAGAWRPGTYRLVVRCAGEGVLVAHFSLGERSVIRQLDACTAATSTDSLELSIDRAAQKSVVVVVPAGESMGAVGYQVHKVR